MARRWDEIQKHIAKLEKRHAVHIAGYGEGNERRLTGLHETSSIHDFRCAHASRSTAAFCGHQTASPRTALLQCVTCHLGVAPQLLAHRARMCRSKLGVPGRVQRVVGLEEMQGAYS